ncbi:polysialyltransferase family glycosyltransferase [Photobacterium phosphoreum]|uniref:polysialyltransferase family glycosyltransferase n=1 Tax=Photobacterium phosphoreum TaxID=659 RepID=UPI0039B0720E
MTLIIEKKISCTYSKVMVTESLYSLALYVFINKYKTSDTLFIIGNRTNIHEVKNKLSNYIVYDSFLAKPKNSFENFLLSNNCLFGRYKEIREYINTNKIDQFYGHDHLSISSMFYKQNMIIIEDGLSNYISPHNIGRIKLNIKKLLNIPIYDKGYDPKTKKIYLTGISQVPLILKNKVLIINRECFVKKLSSMLDGVFSGNISLDTHCTLLITQPISEDGYMSEVDKIEIYKKYSNTNLKLIIKPHPRELTNYKFYFPDAIVIGNEILVESLFENKNIVDFRTLFSSSLIDYNFSRFVTVHILGTELDSRLLKNFGLIPEEIISYPNCY